MMHLDIYADYLRQAEPGSESRTVRMLLVRSEAWIMKIIGPYGEVYGQYKRCSIWTKSLSTPEPMSRPPVAE